MGQANEARAVTTQHDEVRSYLFGTLDDAAAARIEARMFADDAFFEHVRSEIDAVCESFLRDELPPREREHVAALLETPPWRERLDLARALRRIGAETAPAVADVPAVRAAPPVERRPARIARWRWPKPWTLGTVGVVGTAAMALVAALLSGRGSPPGGQRGPAQGEGRRGDVDARRRGGVPADTGVGPGGRPAPERPSGSRAGPTDRTVGALPESAGVAPPSAGREQRTPGSAAIPARGATVVLHDERDTLSVRLAAAAPALTAPQAQALDSVARRLASDTARAVELRYTDPGFDRQSASWHLAELARDRLVLMGVDMDRIRLTRVQKVAAAGLAPGLDAVEVVVARSPRGP